MWSAELWWEDLGPGEGHPAGDQGCTPLFCYPPDLNESRHGWGYLWLRPDLEGETPSPYKQPIDLANHYRPFKITAPWMEIELAIESDQGDWDTPMPVQDVGHPHVDPALLESMARPRRVEIALSAAPLDAVGKLGKYAYASGLAGEDAAVSGLVHVLIDSVTLDVVRYGYATGEVVGSVPASTGFASARFGWKETDPETGEPERDDGLAVFGGALADGSPTARLWIGHFGGVDEDGTPYWNWHDSTPYGAEMPAPRAGATMVPDDEGRRLLVFGGAGEDGGVLSDLWEYDLESGDWSLLSDAFLEVADAAAAMFRGWIYTTGGRNAAGEVDSSIYKFHASQPRAEVVGDLADGPGARESVALGFGAFRAGVILAYGGTGESGIGHNDLWWYDLEHGEWELRVADCSDRACPGPSPTSFIVPGRMGGNVGLYATGDDNRNRFYKTYAGSDEWVGSRRFERPMSRGADCDGDGALEPETSRACRRTDAWYAEVGTESCPDPATGEIVCLAPEAAAMSRIAHWSPSGWEWITDFAAGGDDYSYVLADGTLYTFDLAVIAGEELIPVDEDELEIEGGCWWCLGDFGLDVEVRGGHLYVGALGGLHVFSLEDPADPVQVGFWASYGPVRDMSFAWPFVHLADDAGITIVNVQSAQEPQEIARIDVGAPVLMLDADRHATRLMVLTPTELREYELANTLHPQERDSISVAGPTFHAMRVEGRWTYLNGLWTQSAFDPVDGGLVRAGPHDIRDWVAGRVVEGDLAQRMRPLLNRYEVWAAE